MKRVAVLNINNIVEACDVTADIVIEYVQDIIDDPDLDLPDEAVTPENIRLCQRLQSYYCNQHSYVMGLWGMMRAHAGTDKNRIAMRDYLEGALSSLKRKYDGASRLLTGYTELNKDGDMRERRLW